jgi:hypothetical protein
MKIYTKTGDDGETGLWGGLRVAKDTIRVQAYGTVDECNAAIGVVRAAGVATELDAILIIIQNQLFVVGADLATPGQAAKSPPGRAARPHAWPSPTAAQRPMRATLWRSGASEGGESRLRSTRTVQKLSPSAMLCARQDRTPASSLTINKCAAQRPALCALPLPRSHAARAGNPAHPTARMVARAGKFKAKVRNATRTRTK